MRIVIKRSILYIAVGLFNLNAWFIKFILSFNLSNRSQNVLTHNKLSDEYSSRTISKLSKYSKRIICQKYLEIISTYEFCE